MADDIHLIDADRPILYVGPGLIDAMTAMLRGWKSPSTGQFLGLTDEDFSNLTMSVIATYATLNYRQAEVHATAGTGEDNDN